MDLQTKLNYKISLSEMDRMAKLANSKKHSISLDEMRMQVQNLKNNNHFKLKKNHR